MKKSTTVALSWPARVRSPRVIALIGALFTPLLATVTASPAAAIPMDDYRADVYVVNVDDAGAVAVHGMSAANDYQSFIVQRRTPLPATAGERSDWVYKLADFNGDRVTDLYAIDKDDEGNTSVHILDGRDDFQSFLLEITLPVGVTTDPAWQWDVADYNADGRADLYVMYRNYGDRTTIHVLDAASYFQQWSISGVSGLGASMDPVWQIDIADYDGDRRADMYAINRSDTGRTAVHVLSAASGFQTFVLHKLSALGASMDPVWQLDVADYDGDGRADLFAMNKNDNGVTAVHVLDAQRDFQVYSLHKLSALQQVDHPNWQLEVSLTGTVATGDLPDSVVWRGGPKGDLDMVGEQPFSGTFNVPYKDYEDISFCYTISEGICRFGYHVSRGTAAVKLRTYKLHEKLVNYDYYVVDAAVTNAGPYGASHQGWMKLRLESVGSTVIVDSSDTESISAVKQDCDTLDLSFGAAIGPAGVGVTAGSVKFCGKGASWKIDSHNDPVTVWKAHDLRNISAAASERIVKVDVRNNNKPPVFSIQLTVPSDRCTRSDSAYGVCTDYVNDAIVRSWVVTSTGL